MARQKLPRRCTEFPRPGCKEFLDENAGPRAKTCSNACRSARMRRIAAAKRAGGLAGGEARGMTAEQKESLEDVAHEVMADELRPVVREALTEDNMRSLRSMVGLLPDVVEELAKDIHSKDDLVRQKAHTLLLRYTLGHQSALPKDDEVSGLVVINQMPRPDTTAPEAQPDEVTEVRVCDVCGLEKDTGEFVADSQRCRACMDNLQSKVAGYLGKADG